MKTQEAAVAMDHKNCGLFKNLQLIRVELSSYVVRPYPTQALAQIELQDQAPSSFHPRAQHKNPGRGERLILSSEPNP
ncbi:MAG TPA: hypothetical protein PLB25_21235 [Rhodoferax sp.]|nr:hypothetical protein [Rhodoferax sp.]